MLLRLTRQDETEGQQSKKFNSKRANGFKERQKLAEFYNEWLLIKWVDSSHTPIHEGLWLPLVFSGFLWDQARTSYPSLTIHDIYYL